ncbi:hypothetical protein JI739_14695 [Ramlibacter sp. AW1]|uniref:Thioredoxin-like fold domain-containing protein n=1 Tax=Ramlibacter aurantiacus TaxID=2801330 RepID=A0A936ZIM4_9BURK|nr:hypothetical protein [Ramlibacter aurantiacus]
MPSLPRPASLQAEIARAGARRKSLVLMVSLEGCPYCKLVRESYLLPLRAEGQPVVQIELNLPAPVADPQGRPTTHEQLVREWNVRVAPTLLFLGRGGAELAPRLVGVGNPDFYGAYLDQRIETANRAAAG